MWSQDSALVGMKPFSDTTLHGDVGNLVFSLARNPIFPFRFYWFVWWWISVFCGVWSRTLFSKTSPPCQVAPFLVLWVEGTVFNQDFFFCSCHISWYPLSSASSLEFSRQKQQQQKPKDVIIVPHYSSVPKVPSQSALSPPLLGLLTFVLYTISGFQLNLPRGIEKNTPMPFFLEVEVLCILYF